MKYKYGLKSQERLSTASSDLQLVFNLALGLGLIDISIIEGHRSRAEQNRMYTMGNSKVKFPDSKHNSTPSQAIDAAPYINGEASYNWNHCVYLAGIITTIAKICNIDLRWGGNWDRDGEPITDQRFQDLVHYEVWRNGHE